MKDTRSLSWPQITRKQPAVPPWNHFSFPKLVIGCGGLMKSRLHAAADQAGWPTLVTVKP
eukprot:scaffold186588_cov15-Tisochrysis_lutea.AAC.1